MAEMEFDLLPFGEDSNEDSQEMPTADLMDPSNHRKQRAFLQLLPIEILVAIFVEILCTNHAFVVVLAQLSQGLRGVVLSTPSLWSTLSLSKKKQPERKAALWTDRNQGLLTNLYIRDNSVPVRAALRVLKDVPLDNLRALSVTDIGRNELSKFLPRLTPNVISKLESLSLYYMPYDDSDWLQGVKHLRLRDFRLDFTCVDWVQLAACSTNIRQLTYDEGLVTDAVPDMLEVLRRNSRLKALTLKCRGTLLLPNHDPASFHHPLPSPRSPIELTRLYSLTLLGGALKAEYFIPFLFMPNLRYLELEGLCAQWDDTIRNLISTNAVGRLVSLAIVYLHLHIPDEVLDRSSLLIELLQNANQLKYLELFCVTHVGPILKSLTCDPAAHCPRLVTLDVSRCPDTDGQLLTDLVRARNGTMAGTQGSSNSPTASSTSTVTKLHKLVINSCDKVVEETLSSLREHVPHVVCHYMRTRRQRTEKERRQDAGYW